MYRSHPLLEEREEYDVMPSSKLSRTSSAYRKKPSSSPSAGRNRARYQFLADQDEGRDTLLEEESTSSFDYPSQSQDRPIYSRARSSSNSSTLSSLKARVLRAVRLK